MILRKGHADLLALMVALRRRRVARDSMIPIINQEAKVNFNNGRDMPKDMRDALMILRRGMHFHV